MGGPDTAPFVTATWHTTLEIKLKENTKEIEDQNDADVVVNKQGDASYKFCSGVIVNKRIILTSGHCLKNAEDNGWYIYFNFDGTTGYNGGARRLVTHHRIYEPYNTNPTPENDFGVVYINTPILFNSTVTKAELSLINAREFANSVWSDCQMAGTGEIFTQSICMPRPTKKYMKGFLVSSDCCKAALQHTDGAAFTADSLCYRSLDAMPCLGDSGAGLSCKK
ncbi:Chymotrypsin-2-like protein [Aphelenchoides besseyi]|nr:Chymotrypsin-2-like protein [Aphelenchoides besseyi]